MIRQRLVQLAAAALLAGGLLAASPASPAMASTPTCDWVALYNNAWVPMYKAGNTVTCNMVQGTHSAAVQKLQYTMNYCYGENLALDSDFGPATKAALIRVQRIAGTPADGQYGPNTRRAMYWVDTNGYCVQVG
ncbi:peptidoglycan-binding protein [Longispora fulva]|uniref:Peptidoglycan hydrolase-like protein with peptidoglycan-binding domain n=1 Tax=Longispora fulva TaxID=619741 RepID=A0A8J7G6Z1_9ACTN|nr:peptidoglycan-binding domain-containing protein [Longispora fulva]MBG6134823.1 peptidoglycan hydrolase-like protein with peptidoglycan-binding domain [Longispora fulva]GIG56945.1 peptidoglycan-binding protein [Longispora fulva]